MDFRVSRPARDRYAFDEALFSTRGDTVVAAPQAARRFAYRMAAAGASRPDRPVSAGDVDAMGLIHELQHTLIARAAARGGDRPIDEALQLAADDLGPERSDRSLAAFEDAFPGLAVYAAQVDARGHLDGDTEGQPNREIALEELLLVWVANQNPAFMRYDELFDHDPLRAATDYEKLVEAVRRVFAERALTEPGGQDVVERLLGPGRAAPDSLSGQLRYIRDNWADVLDPDLLARITLGLDILTEEKVAARRAFEGARGGAGADADAAALHGFSGEEETQRFSPDRDWMPEVVLLAKSTYVWLDQLSRRYGRPIWTLDAIPDEELDQMRGQGFTGLWLIGLWERSHASQRIKQLRGNPEAVASAYSLMDYRIAEDLGGEAAYSNLRDRAWARGIRLASDMVPNHMGIDSRWVVEHPERFISRSDPPFPAYSFEGPNLSTDERVGIYLEDHYYDGTDAAVVFKRVDRWSGQVRYIYHGNDGTSYPWNDTAQLDYLSAEVREAVTRTIVAVARRFPIIRFDAAMVLAKRHVQRLWYPLPGGGGAIPSRAESALSQADFDARMPQEFWREVVDRVAEEVPGTLLLAEAFWLMEGYFVRTLGMHRVYNSAFMNMMRDEKNAEYRAVIRETVGFDPEILKRYVNFMNNPDERTAIDQFGDGDKYFGVATLLATLPGLPMFGHGQVEGLSERYGMEFRRATLDETPNEALMARHDREIFPLVRQRGRFADAKDFRLLDLVHPDGSVDENVFAYANGPDGARALIVFHNRYAETRGWVRDVGASLPVADDPDHWLILHDERSGLEYLRNGHDLHTRGLELDLQAYACKVFLAFEEVVDGGEREWSRLAWNLGLEPVPSVHERLVAQRLESVAGAVAAAVDPEAFRRIAGAGIAGDDAAAAGAVAEVVSGSRASLERIAAEGSAAAVAEGSAGTAGDRLERALTTLVTAVRRGRSADAPTEGHDMADERALAAWLGTRRERWGTLVGWAYADAVTAMARPGQDGRSSGAFEGWQLDRVLGDTLRELGLDAAAAWRGVELVRALLAVEPEASERAAAAITEGAPVSWFELSAVRAATGWNSYDAVPYVNREAYEEWVDVLAARDAVAGVRGAYGAATSLKGAAAASGFRVSPPEPDAADAAGDPDTPAAPELVLADGASSHETAAESGEAAAADA